MSGLRRSTSRAFRRTVAAVAAEYVEHPRPLRQAVAVPRRGRHPGGSNGRPQHLGRIKRHKIAQQRRCRAAGAQHLPNERCGGDAREGGTCLGARHVAAAAVRVQAAPQPGEAVILPGRRRTPNHRAAGVHPQRVEGLENIQPVGAGSCPR